MLLTNTQFVLLLTVDTYTFWADVADTDNQYDYLLQHYSCVMFMVQKLGGWGQCTRLYCIHTAV